MLATSVTALFRGDWPAVALVLVVAGAGLLVWLWKANDERPLYVSAAYGLRLMRAPVGSPVAPSTEVTVEVEVRKPLAHGLWVTTAPYVDVRATATAKQRRADGLRRQVEVMALPGEKGVFLWILDRDSETGERLETSVEVTLRSSSQPIKRVRISPAALRHLPPKAKIATMQGPTWGAG